MSILAHVPEGEDADVIENRSIETQQKITVKYNRKSCSDICFKSHFLCIDSCIKIANSKCIFDPHKIAFCKFEPWG